MLYKKPVRGRGSRGSLAVPRALNCHVITESTFELGGKNDAQIGLIKVVYADSPHHIYPFAFYLSTALHICSSKKQREAHRDG